MVINMSGRGDKDMGSVAKYLEEQNNMSRLPERFAELAGEERPGLVTFVTAGDPDMEHSKLFSVCCPRPERTSLSSVCLFPIRWRMDQPFRRPASALL